jgi:hypothetical protein
MTGVVLSLVQTQIAKINEDYGRGLSALEYSQIVKEIGTFVNIRSTQGPFGPKYILLFSNARVITHHNAPFLTHIIPTICMQGTPCKRRRILAASRQAWTILFRTLCWLSQQL